MENKLLATIAAGIVAIGAHAGGFLRFAEREVSPSLAKTSFNLADQHWWSAEFGAARNAITELSRGSSDDQMVAKIVCHLLSTWVTGTPAQLTWQNQIYSQLPEGAASDPYVQKAVDSASAKLALVTNYRGLYLEVCTRRG